MKLAIHKLDWYIIKKFIGTYFFSIGLIISIAVVFDYAEKMDDFYKYNAPLKEIIFSYYLNFIPYFANLFSSLFIFISVIFFTSKMAYNTEIIAILSSGVSFKRLMWPYFLASAFLAILSFLLSGYIIPPANKNRLEFEWTYVKPNAKVDAVDLHRQIEPDVFLYLSNFNSYNDIAKDLSIEKFEKGNLKSKLICDYAKWDTAKTKWTVHNYYIRTFENSKEIVTSGYSMDTTLNVMPSDLTTRKAFVQGMNNYELKQYIEDQKMQGATVEEFEVERYSRFAYPFSTFILALIGVTLSSRKTRGGMGLNIGIGLLISFTYILFMRFTAMFAVGGSLPPAIAVWIPNILFAVIGVWLYRKAPK